MFFRVRISSSCGGRCHHVIAVDRRIFATQTHANFFLPGKEDTNCNFLISHPLMLATLRVQEPPKSDKESSSSTNMKLSASTIGSLSSLVAVPNYDFKALEPGVLHFGVGNFHRSHMATYFDDLFNNDFESHKEWGIVGTGVFPADKTKRAFLESQDWMQTIVEQDTDHLKARVIGSMCDFLPIDLQVIRQALTNDKIKIVSLTVTEGGYFLKDEKLDLHNELIQHDIQNPTDPKTIFGMIIESLRARKENGKVPFSVMSCDNIPHNGNVVRSVVVNLAKETDPELAKWIDENVGFPNSMVDRITPGSTPEQEELVRVKFGYEDKAPVTCEPFRQWVIEDNFSKAGRPPLDSLDNVKFVSDVTPYEFMKLRILNGGHASLCYPGSLLGLNYVHECMEHPVISAFLDTLEKDEIIPTVGEVPDVDVTGYWGIIQKRFSNPTLNDTLRRNCFDGASRQPKFIIPAIRDNLEAGRSVDGLAMVSALWCRYCQGLTESGETIENNDPQWERLQATALRAKGDPENWLRELVDVYGETISSHHEFVTSFSRALNSINSDGVESALKMYAESKAATLA